MTVSNFVVNFSNANCADGKDECPDWAAWGECDVNPEYLLTTCRLSCGTCISSPCVDGNPVQCPLWANNGECEINPVYMMNKCKRSCHNCRFYK